MEIIIGPMFSGKSTELCRRITRLESINKNVLKINNKNDTRCNDVIQTHDKKTIKAIKLENLRDIFGIKEFNDIDVIAIDEAQFFNDLYNTVVDLLDMNKHCIICGLDGDANQSKFGQILDLIPLSDRVDKLSGYCNICNDTTPGNFTIKREGTDRLKTIEIGDKNIYLCVCRRHLILHNRKDNLEKSNNHTLLRTWDWLSK